MSLGPKVRRAAELAKGLPPAEGKTLVLLTTFLEHGASQPPVAEIGRRAKLGSDVVRDALASLERRGLVRIKRGRETSRNSYELGESF